MNEKSKVDNPTSKKKKRMWIIGILLGCYIVSKAFGLNSSISDEDTLSLIGQNINDTNKLYGEGKWYDALNAVDTVTEEMNDLDAQVVEEKAAAGYSVEERGYRNYSFEYDSKSMKCCVSFQGGVVTGVSSYES